MAPPTGRLVACAPSLLLGASCILAWTFILNLSSERLTEARVSTHVIAQAWSLFVAGVKHPVGFLIIGEHCFLSFDYALLRGFESCRARARWGPIITVPLLQLLPVPLGGSLSFSVLWLPTYLLSGSQDRSPWAFKGKVLSRNRFIQSISLVFSTFLLSLLAVAFAHKGTWAVHGVTILFNTTPLLLRFHSFVIRFGRPELPDQLKAEQTAYITYTVASSIALLWRALALVLLFRNPLLTSQLLDLFRERGASDSVVVVWIFGVDLFFLTLSLAYFALVEDGVGVALRTVVGALVLGPAAAFAGYCAWRERQIQKSMETVRFGISGEVAKAA